MSADQKTFYRPDIDGLRTIAVAIVVAYHAGFPGFSGGYIGVDVFFVISGFLITRLLFKEVENTGTINLSSFYAKRFKRLYPALVVVILSVIALWGLLFLGVPTNTNAFIKSIRYSIFGLANIFFNRNTGGYFDAASEEMPLLHFWSLAVEEQFYVFWPLLIIGIAKTKWWATNLTKKTTYSLVLVILSSFIFTEILIQTNNHRDAFYWMPARAWELGIGGLIFFLQNKFSEFVKNTVVLNLLGITGLVSIIGCTFFYNLETVFPGKTAIIPVLGTSLLIIAGGIKNTFSDRLLSLSWMTKLGILSYGWYLWHWPLLALQRVHLMGETPHLSWRIAAVIISLILAQLSLTFIETPLRFGKKINALKARSVIWGTLSLSLVIVFLSTSLRVIEKKIAPMELKELTKLAEQRTSAQFGCDGSTESFKDKNCVHLFQPANIGPIKEIVLWGDSHAQSFFPMIEDFARKSKSNAYIYSANSQVPLLGVENIYSIATVKPNGPFNKKVFESLTRQSKSKQVSVVLGSRWTAFTGHQPISVKDKKSFLNKEMTVEGSLQLMESSLQKTLSELTAIGVYKILIILPYPEFKYDVLMCYQGTKCDTSLSKFETYRKDVKEIFNRVTKDFPNVKLIDPTETFCSNGNCPQMFMTEDNRKIPVVYDDDHASVAAAIYMVQKNMELLEWLIN